MSIIWLARLGWRCFLFRCCTWMTLWLLWFRYFTLRAYLLWCGFLWGYQLFGNSNWLGCHGIFFIRQCFLWVLWLGGRLFSEFLLKFWFFRYLCCSICLFRRDNWFLFNLTLWNFVRILLILRRRVWTLHSFLYLGFRSFRWTGRFWLCFSLDCLNLYLWGCSFWFGDFLLGWHSSCSLSFCVWFTLLAHGLVILQN